MPAVAIIRPDYTTHAFLYKTFLKDAGKAGLDLRGAFQWPYFGNAPDIPVGHSLFFTQGMQRETV
jgi:hypothetical protein